ncbi:hypothetical protein J2046_002055 [Rhizobium petrolearium]|uniref:hypothetical protein n=1 Tax=Neorhizobium petrolearium TaxID=515361 RepID=UPI001AE4CFC0|nr:hypothetical protein [Neorhizobium petrolearium]MBP1843799.1 hypothetical protein [Neorhizobium petrolearium]
MNDDLIQPEIEVLQMLAGQRPGTGSVAEWICLEELGSRGLCTNSYPRLITPRGLAALEMATNTIDLRSRSQRPRPFSLRQIHPTG